MGKYRFQTDRKIVTVYAGNIFKAFEKVQNNINTEKIWLLKVKNGYSDLTIH